MLMRTKVLFELPWVNQKHAQLAHSYFAFNGWISFTLLWLLVDLLHHNGITRLGKYKGLLGMQWALSWCLLISYLLHGMSYWSFVVESCMFGCVLIFATAFLRDVYASNISQQIKAWLVPAWFFYVLAGVGPMLLFWHYMHRTLSMTNYLSAFYGYLHFQFNGWFLFASLALLSQMLLKIPGVINHQQHARIFAVLSFFGLLFSLLWMQLPTWLYVTTIVIGALQICLALHWFNSQKSALKSLANTLHQPYKSLLIIAGLALVARMLFQQMSTIPVLERAAFSFRPIIVGYIHLVLLGIFSSFLLFTFFYKGILAQNRLSFWGIICFILGFLATEVLLAVQGAASFAYVLMPWASSLLFACTMLFPLGLLLLLVSVNLHKSARQLVDS